MQTNDYKEAKSEDKCYRLMQIMHKMNKVIIINKYNVYQSMSNTKFKKKTLFCLQLYTFH